ncbi:uncharacterized protein BXZ73DRAFT_104276 [Epithele typhae]|uniref:uncharacterized protein n=1 Tax=Epithele typhae TaxID=378194 RepID=UPI00200821C6|nr:uncharacterized protein BXZ73DRAFT_104276 [Epithele typhae]KAH9922019.1 hypothetical protein BXZ73DRAFT_104276 [Epithele typhae]
MAANFSNLPEDVLHDILLCMCDFHDLGATIRVSKNVYDVFNSRKHLVVRAVLQNVAGPAWVQAARFAHIRLYGPFTDDPPLPEESYFEDLDWAPSRDILDRMEYAQEVRRLQAFYSQRNKDRKSLQSVLDLTEAMKFDRALYRLWLYVDLYEDFVDLCDDESESESDDDDDDDGYDGRTHKRARLRVTQLLQKLSTEELLEAIHISSFLQETKRWLGVMHANYKYRATLPEDVLAGVQTALEVSIDIGFPAFTSLASPLLASRKVKKETIDECETSPTIILATVPGSKDTCTRCGASGGTRLIGSPNAWIFAGECRLQDRKLLPGLLMRNPWECDAMYGHLWHGNGGKVVDEAALFHEMVNLDMGPDAESWSKDGWYCLDCMRELHRQRFMQWWKVTKAKNGAPVLDDCWYGYNCRTMIHQQAHATKLNHLCTPTRGNGA